MTLQQKGSMEMDLKRWREQQVEKVTLPSGLAMILKKVSLTDLVMNGDIPNTLMGVFEDAQKAGDFDPEEFLKTFDFSDVSKFASIYGAVAMACAVEPQILNDPTEEALGVKELPYEDKKYIFEWANGEATKLNGFCQEEGKP